MASSHDLDDLLNLYKSKYDCVSFKHERLVYDDSVVIMLRDEDFKTGEQKQWAFKFDKLILATVSDPLPLFQVHIENLCRAMEDHRKAQGRDVVSGLRPTVPPMPSKWIWFDKNTGTIRDADKPVKQKPKADAILEKREAEQRKKLVKYGRY